MYYSDMYCISIRSINYIFADLEKKEINNIEPEIKYEYIFETNEKGFHSTKDEF